ncbi:MAG: acetyl-CoA hydrolase/transferase family protein [Ramlibacter sp.]
MRELDPADLRLAGLVRAGDRVMWGQACAEPLLLTRALMAQRAEIGRFSAFVGVSLADTVQPAHADHVDFVSYCGGGLNRALARAGVLDIQPAHYTQLPDLLGRQVDVLLLQLAPAGPDGRHSMALACDYLVPAIAGARLVIAEINDQAPATCGPHTLGPQDIDWFVRSSRPPLELARGQPHPDEAGVARQVASLVEDGDTIQHGIGALPDAIVALLADRRELGLHTGVMGDAAASLVRAGVITNAHKTIDAGVCVAGVLMGTRELNALVDRNPALQLREVRYIHALRTLAAIDNLVTINSAIEVDLTGQVNTEVADGVYVGAVGGAVDFIRGAGAAKNGRPIVALPSRTAGKGIPRIVARLGGPAGAARSDAAIIVTEQGIADLRGLTLRQRVERMVAVAHPQDRDALRAAARALA